MINIATSWYDFKSNSIEYDDTNIEEPRQCMHCLNTGTQIPLGCFKTHGMHDNHRGIALFSCPLCGSTSIHYLTSGGLGGKSHLWSSKSIPFSERDPLIFSNTIQDKFSSFCKIYTQSQRAEKEELDQIAGMGYRKALEFLVTDYLIQFHSDEIAEEWLTSPKTTLGNKISKIPSTRIQTLAKAISYLGNDETHYSKQHPEHDIDSIKAFIRVLVSEIDNEIEFQKAEALINKPRT